MFLDFRLGRTLSWLVAEKGKYPNKLLFWHNNKAFCLSQDGGMKGQVGDAEEVDRGGRRMEGEGILGRRGCIYIEVYCQ